MIEKHRLLVVFALVCIIAVLGGCTPSGIVCEGVLTDVDVAGDRILFEFDDTDVVVVYVYNLRTTEGHRRWQLGQRYRLYYESFPSIKYILTRIND